MLGTNALGKYTSELGDGHEIVATMKGSQLSGVRYQPMLPYFTDHADSFRVLVDDYVTDDDGTGVVHMAPGFGEDDQRVCEAAGIALVVPGRRCRPLHRRGDRLGRAERLRCQPAASSRHLKAAGAVVTPRHLSTTTTRTAGAPTHRSSTRPSRPGTSRSPTIT
ncbi:MAG: hypothetical protein V9E94_04665 [Microthrixaceae bacterium]